MAIGNELISVLNQAKKIGLDVKITELGDGDLSVEIDCEGTSDFFVACSIDHLIRRLSYTIQDYSAPQNID